MKAMTDAGEGAPTQRVVAVRQTAAPPRAPRASSALMTHLENALEAPGRIILWLSGAGLIALACLFAANATIAPIFAAFGAGIIVLTAFYSRVDGQAKVSARSVELTLAAALAGARERNLPSDELPAVAGRAVENVAYAGRAKDAREAARAAGREAVEWGATQAQARHDDVLRSIEEWLIADGAFASVRRDVRTPIANYDVIAETGDAALLLEAIVGLTVDRRAVRQLLALPIPADLGVRHVRRALAVPADTTLTSTAVNEAGAGGVEIYEVWPDGRVEQVTWPASAPP
jgi:hypothetical protein